MTQPPNYYHVLGLIPPASPEQIRAAYVRLIKQLHQDRARPGPPSMRLHQLQQAYHSLRDAERRGSHDQMLFEREQLRRSDVRRIQRRIRRLDQGRARPLRRAAGRNAGRYWMIAAASGGLLALLATNFLLL